jgi:hypothetical protein
MRLDIRHGKDRRHRLRTMAQGNVVYHEPSDTYYLVFSYPEADDHQRVFDLTAKKPARLNSDTPVVKVQNPTLTGELP